MPDFRTTYKLILGKGLAELLGIPSGDALDSCHYLANGEGTSGVLTLLGADGETELRLP